MSKTPHQMVVSNEIGAAINVEFAGSDYSVMSAQVQLQVHCYGLFEEKCSATVSQIPLVIRHDPQQLKWSSV
jgi:hypothetical protein